MFMGRSSNHRVSCQVLALFCMFMLILLTNSVDAAEPGVKTADARRFASVWRLRGDITATTADSGKVRSLREGDPVFVGERIRAASSGEGVLKTDDAGFIAVRPGAEFLAEKFAAHGKATDNFSLRLVTGALRVITGWVGKLNRAESVVITPTATIGIRGTDHEPYVMSAELAEAMAQKEGTYDKVNRGGTTLDASGNKVDIEPGKVGFVRAQKPFKSRALMTILLPVLLEEVPAFYIPGQFDGELDLLSQVSEENAVRLLEERRKVPVESSVLAAPEVSESASVATTASVQAAVPAAAIVDRCGAQAVAKKWLVQLDAAITRRDARAVVRMFAPEVSFRATVRDASGEPTTLELGRDEFAQSTITAVKNLTDYRQRRPSTVGKPLHAGVCDRILVKSVVIEQGKQNGSPYRFESVEEFVLERRAGRWLAVKAETTQR